MEVPLILAPSNELAAERIEARRLREAGREDANSDHSEEERRLEREREVDAAFWAQRAVISIPGLPD